jgi:hypothetical protein
MPVLTFFFKEKICSWKLISQRRPSTSSYQPLRVRNKILPKKYTPKK